MNIAGFLHSRWRVAKGTIKRDDGVNTLVTCSSEKRRHASPAVPHHGDFGRVGILQRLCKCEQKRNVLSFRIGSGKINRHDSGGLSHAWAGDDNIAVARQIFTKLNVL